MHTIINQFVYTLPVCLEQTNDITMAYQNRQERRKHTHRGTTIHTQIGKKGASAEIGAKHVSSAEITSYFCEFT